MNLSTLLIEQGMAMKPDSKTLTEQPAKDVVELSTDFIGAERNLELIGFFSPSYNDRRKIPKKTISGTVTNKNGQKVKVQLSILPSAEYGLPITTDLDIYRAFQKILKDIYLEQGEITNPVAFRDEQIIKAMGKKRQGTYNKQIRTWLHRMKFTWILSEGLIYDKGKKQYIEDSVNVFDRTIAFGKELESGKMAAKNYVWLSEWYLNNINSRYAFLIDNETHKRLKTAIAKSLYPILWFRFYGMRKQNASCGPCGLSAWCRRS